MHGPPRPPRKGVQITLTLRPAKLVRLCGKSDRDAAKVIVFTEDGWFDSDKPQTITAATPTAASPFR
jgi:hypothetical protein